MMSLSLKSEACSSTLTGDAFRRSSRSGDAMEIIKHFYQEAVESTSLVSVGSRTNNRLLPDNP